MVLHANDGRSIERGVGLSMSVPRESVSVGHSRRRRDRRHATEFGEAGLNAKLLCFVFFNNV
jgi:hypothetical protein